MTKDDLGSMEGEILQEESTGGKKPAEVKKKVGIPFQLKIKTIAKAIFFSMNGPKLIAIAILIMSIIVVYLALLVSSSSQNQEEKTNNIDKDAQSSPLASPDSDLVEINRKIKNFNLDVEKLNTLRGNLNPPSINFDIKYE